MIAGKGVPLLGEEGWLRHQEDAAKPPYEGADGVVSPGQRYNVNFYPNDHPVCAASEASRLFLTGAATPPVPGGEHPVLAIHSHLPSRGVTVAQSTGLRPWLHSHAAPRLGRRESNRPTISSQFLLTLREALHTIPQNSSVEVCSVVHSVSPLMKRIAVYVLIAV